MTLGRFSSTFLNVKSLKSSIMARAVLIMNNQPIDEVKSEKTWASQSQMT